VIGQSPFNIERIFDQMERATSPYAPGGLAGMAMAGVDLALWDLMGKILKQPVYNLIGGKVRDEIPCYVTIHPDFAEDWVQRGFKGVKIASPYGVESGRDGILKMEEIIANLRAKVGDRAEIMVDCYMSWSIEFASRLAERVKKYDVKWFEDALPNGYCASGSIRLAWPSAISSSTTRRFTSCSRTAPATLFSPR
jgi:L-rhamnonate dehydratase